MAFGGNTTPKKKKLPAGSPWVCKCQIQQPRYLLYCPRCQTGQAKP